MAKPVYLIIRDFYNEIKVISKIKNLEKYTSLEEYLKDYDLPSMYNLEVVFDNLEILTFNEIVYKK